MKITILLLSLLVGAVAAKGAPLVTGQDMASVNGATVTWTGSNTFTAQTTMNSLDISSIQSGTQCLQINSSGHVSGYGAGCGGSGNASLVSTQTFSGANTFTSSVTFDANVLGTINHSTATILTMAASPTMGPCIAGTTITFTTENVLLNVVLTGGAVQPANSGNALINVLIDGKYIDHYTSSTGMWTGNDDATIYSPSINYLTMTAVSAGSHSFCITGTNFVNSHFCDLSPCQFRVAEFH